MKRSLPLLSIIVLVCSAMSAQRLPDTASPDNYKLLFTPHLNQATFDGDETISIRILKPTSEITLNSADINFHEATITSGGSTQTAKVTPEKDKEMVVLSVDKPLATGPATIHIIYSGTLNDEMRGFYLGKDDQGRKYAATQFESTDARRAFPSFDEPAYKATFDISVVVPKDQVAISNQEIVSDTPGPGNGHTIRFATTVKMSSYLAALVVGHFEYIGGEADGIPIRVYGTPGKKDMGQFALETAEHVLSYYDKYFNIKYPYGKLDLVGLPDFSAGAMENTGCITFREILLQIDDKHGSVDLKKEIASVIAHEMAHQWFGDLVTMKWWDDVWLNEGFATWMSSKPLEAWKPEWHFDLDDVSDTGHTLDTDSLANTRPIHQPAETPSQILELFDSIAYGKAAAVLRMLESYLGEETFRSGVNAYIQRYQYTNATAGDFWEAQARASKKPVDKIMPTFIVQAGVPIIDVKSQCTGGSTKITAEQHRYYYDRENFQNPGDELWEVPLCMKGSADGLTKCELLTKKEREFTQPGCSDWVLVNANASGYYRVGYEPQAVRVLAKNADSKLSPAEKIALETDVWASVRVGREPIGGYLAFTEGLAGDRNRAVLEEAFAHLNYISDYLITDNDQNSYQKWLRGLFDPMLNEIGWEPKPGESDEQRMLRARLFTVLGVVARDPEVMEQARKIADSAITNPNSVDHELAGAVLRIVALTGGDEFYNNVMSAVRTAKTPEEYYNALYALAQFNNPSLLEKTLNFAVSPDVRSQDALRVINGIMHNPAGQKLAWDFVLGHWDAVQKAGGPFASAEIVSGTGSFCDAKMRDQVKEFYAAHKIEAAERTYRQSIELIDNCIDLKTQQEPQLASWLQKHGTMAGGE